MTSPSGYNNPAYSHQFDSFLYDYQYVPEIDPDYDGHPDHEQEQIHLVHPNLCDEFSGTSEEFDASDESNQSIIVEECNNRRVTLICEKRNKMEERVYEDKNCKGAYHHNISLESEEDFKMSRQEGKTTDGISLRHQRRLNPPPDSVSLSFANPYETKSPTNHLVQQCNLQELKINQRPQRQHRYEEIGNYDDEEMNRSQRVSRHRYAEITVDENGYPSIGNEIEIEHNESGYRILNMDAQRLPATQKPRAASPVRQSFSPTFSPSKTYQRTVSPRPPDVEMLRTAPTTKSVPTKNVIEMAELSPPNQAKLSKKAHTSFFQSPKRQPPIGASSPAVLQEQMKSRHGKTGHNGQGSVTTRNVTPSKAGVKPSVTQIFQARTTPKASQPSTPKRKSQEQNSSRRNISCAFRDAPEEIDDVNFNSKSSSPYRPTTAKLTKAKTAVITPILLRKNRTGCGEELGNFTRTSHMFQSTGNLYKKGGTIADQYCASPEVLGPKAKIRRNKSVPNFAQSLANDGKFKYGRGSEMQSVHKSARKLDYQYSPGKSMDRFSPINRSRISLIDQTKISWSNSASDFNPPNSGCLIIGAIIQIATSIASCAICFYLFSKLGRRYYLDFGILAGFVNFILGVLGFRSHCWRWLPNRNYVSGYILLTAFSILTCTGFVYLITARPMAGDPILDVMGGGICGVSVLTIVIAVTGLTMSGCCKTPPPDNRVNNI